MSSNPINSEYPESPTRVDLSATLLYGLVLGLVPFLFIPVPLLDYPTINSEILLVKEIGIRVICGLILLLGTFKVFTQGFAPLLKSGLIPVSLINYSALSVLSALFSSNVGFSLHYLYSEQLLVWSVLFVPYFFKHRGQVQFLVFSALTSCVLCSLFSVAVWLTNGEALVLIYGANIRELLFGGGAGVTIEGGIRSLYMSTLGNPEFAGNFLAIGVLLSGLFAWNQFGVKSLQNRPYASILLGAIFTSITGFAMLLTQTRGSLLVLAFCGMLWGYIQLRFSIKLLAVAMLVFGAVFFLLGILIAVAAFGLFLIILLITRLKIDGLKQYYTSFHPHQRVLLGAFVALGIMGFLSAAFVPPVQNRLAPIAERITSAGSVNDRSIRERLLFYLLASEMVVEHPILGVGPGMYPANFHNSMSKVVSEDSSGVMAYNQRLLKNFVAFEAHNDYFQISSEQGFLGISAFLLMIAALFQPIIRMIRQSREAESNLALVLFVSISGYLSMMLMSFPLQEPARAAHFFGLLATAYALVHVGSLSHSSEGDNS